MNVPAEKQAALETERRWMKPAGAAAILGSLAFQAGLYIGGAALEGDSTSERLLEAAKGDADGQLLLGVLISAVGFVLMAAALTFLLFALRNRSERVLKPLIAMPLIGALLLGGGLVLNNFSYLDAAEDFAAAEGQSVQAGGTTEETTVAPETTTPEEASEESEDEAEDDADDRAEDALNDAPNSGTSALMVRGGALLFAIGFFYAGLWSMRTGLLSRFWGSLGMASAVVLALFFLYFFGLVWFLGLGLLLLGAWVGGRPPAWEAGIPIPWPKPGEPAPEASGDTIEGEGREVTDRDLGEGEGEGEESSNGPAEPPRKRKRRR